jgi:hypothetical protein
MLTRCLLQLGPELQNSRCNLHLVPTTTWSTDVYARDCIDNYGTCSQYFPMIALTIMERVASTFPCDTKNRQSGQCMLQKVAWHHKEMYTTKSVTSIWGQFLSLGFFSLGDKKKSSSNSFKGFLLKKCVSQNLQILRNLRFFFLKSSYLDNVLYQVTKIQQSKIYLLSSLTCSQIWLILLVDDC